MMPDEKVAYQVSGTMNGCRCCGVNSLTLTNQRALYREETHGCSAFFCRCCCQPCYRDIISVNKNISLLDDQAWLFMSPIGYCMDVFADMCPNFCTQRGITFQAVGGMHRIYLSSEDNTKLKAELPRLMVAAVAQR